MIPFIGDLVFTGLIIWFLVNNHMEMRRRHAEFERLMDSWDRIEPVLIDIPDLRISTIHHKDIKVIRHAPKRGVRK